MALRHPVPKFEFQRRGVVAEEGALRIIPKLREPMVIPLSKGFDEVRVAAEVLAAGRASVVAAPGAGKSTKLPVALAEAVKGAGRGGHVYHVVPSRLLAADLHGYVRGCMTAAATFAWEVEEVHAAPPGLVNLSAATMVATLLEGGFDTSGGVLYLDEVHESDCYMFTLSKLSAVLGFRAVVFATATTGVTQFPPVQVSGQLRQVVYAPDEEPGVWDVEEKGKPWCMAGLSSHIVVFSDEYQALRPVASKYQEAGMLVYHMHARTSLQDFRSTMSRMWDPAQPMSMYVLDYSFRSGFTLDAERVIDLCTVKTVVVQDGQARVERRRAYEFETYQAAARVGRVAGTRAVYHRPEYAQEALRVVVEGVEADAAAHIFTLLGWRAPKEVAGSLLSKPITIEYLHSALDGPVPLVSIVSRGGATMPRSASPARQGTQEAAGRVAGEAGPTPPASPKTFSRAPRMEPEPSRGRSVSVGMVAEPSRREDGGGKEDQYLTIQSVLEVATKDHPPQLCEGGKYYALERGQEAAREVCHRWFRGRSLTQVYEEVEVEDMAMVPVGIRAYAVRRLLQHANNDSAEIEGMIRVLKTIPRAERDRLSQCRATRHWVRGLAERADYLKHGVEVRHTMVTVYAAHDVQIYPMVTPEEAVHEYEKVFQQAYEGVRGAPDVDAMMEVVSRMSRNRAKTIEDAFRQRDVGLVRYDTREGLAKYTNTIRRIRPPSRGEPGEYQLSVTPRNTLATWNVCVSGTPSEIIVQTRPPSHVRGRRSRG